MADDRSDERTTTEARETALLRLTTEILPQAVKRHLEVLRDPKAAGQTLNRAVEIAIKYGLAGQIAAGAKQPHEMTAAELAEAIAVLERAASSRAVQIQKPGDLGSSGVFG